MESQFKTDFDAEDMRKWYNWFNSDDPKAVKAREDSELHQQRILEAARKDFEESTKYFENYLEENNLSGLFQSLIQKREHRVVSNCIDYFREYIESHRKQSRLKDEVRNLLKEHNE